MTGEIQQTFSLDTVVQRIFELRGQRVMMGSDLAILYGVEYRALIQAVKRNLDRFPEDFIFQLSSEEWGDLKSQNVISNLRFQFGTSNDKDGRGGSRHAPYAFTEHGALMLSSVLNSPRAKEISVMIVRAFVWLRQSIPAYKELASKVAELEGAVSKHDESIKTIVQALQQMIVPPDKPSRKIGF
jgi:hypothetical protein